MHIINLESHNASKATEVARSSSFIVQTKVVLNCSSSQGTTFEWFLYMVKQDGKYLRDRSPILDTKGAEWNIPQRSLDYGLYLIELRVAMKSFSDSYSSAVGFLKVVASELVASISGGTKVTRGANKIITLDASPSEDPDVGPGNHTGMQFTWLCKREGEHFPKGVLDKDLPIVYPTPKGSVGRGGCYDTGIGRLESNSVKISMDTGKMRADQLYNVVVVVTKGIRNASFAQVLNLVPGEPPDIAIK